MKFTIVFISLTILSASVYCQSNNNISLVYASTPNSINIHNVIADFGYKDQTGSTVGLNYQRYILEQVFSLQSGLFYSYDKVQLTYIFPTGLGVGYQNGDIKMLTIPILANITFLRYFFVDGGVNVDFQTNYTGASAAPNQSVIGY